MTNAEISRTMCELGLVPEDFLAVKQAVSLVEARELLRLLKDKARRGFKKAALRLHPDVGGDAQLFIQVKEAFDNIEAMQLRRPVPRPVRQSVYVNVYGMGSATSTTSTMYTGTGSGVYRVVWST